MRQSRPLTDKWTFSTNGVSIMGRNGIPCIGFGPGAEAQAHAPNEKTWKQDLVTVSLYMPHFQNATANNKKIHTQTGGFLKCDAKLQGYIDKLNALNFKDMYNGDFFLTWEKSDDEIEAVFTVANALRYMRENNISTKVFESGLGISLFRDNSTRTRSSFASACNLLGLEVQDLDEGKSQVAHGETVRETANMISFMADVIGIRDDMYIGKGNKYMHEVVDAVTAGNKDGILEQKPTLVNLQCDIDHPTQAMADAPHHPRIRRR